MTRYQVTSTCDDAGFELAERINNPSFTRTVIDVVDGQVIRDYDSREAAVKARKDLIAWYRAKEVPVGPGCIGIREVE